MASGGWELWISYDGTDPGFGCRMKATSTLVCALLGAAGRFPSAFALKVEVPSSARVDTPSFGVEAALLTVCAAWGKLCGLLGPLDEATAFVPTSEGPAEEYELVFLASIGRLLPLEATNFRPAAVTFFLGGDLIAARISRPGVIVLPDEGISSSFSASSSDACGDTNRAVGRGPVVEGPLGFFKIGWGGGGLNALVTMSFDMGILGVLTVVLLAWEVDSSSLPCRRCRKEVIWLSSSQTTRFMQCGKSLIRTSGPSHRFGGPRKGTKVGPSEISL